MLQNSRKTEAKNAVVQKETNLCLNGLLKASVLAVVSGKLVKIIFVILEPYQITIFKTVKFLN